MWKQKNFWNHHLDNLSNWMIFSNPITNGWVITFIFLAANPPNPPTELPQTHLHVVSGYGPNRITVSSRTFSAFRTRVLRTVALVWGEGSVTRQEAGFNGHPRSRGFPKPDFSKGPKKNVSCDEVISCSDRKAWTRSLNRRSLTKDSSGL